MTERIFAAGVSQVNTGPVDNEILRRMVGAAVPPGTIIAMVGGFFGNGSNGSFTSVLGNSVNDINTWLANNGYRGWRVCDGSELEDSESPIYGGAGRYLPNLLNSRFLSGDSSAGAVGGNNDATHTHTINAHGHTYTNPSVTVAKHYHSKGNISIVGTVVGVGNGGMHGHPGTFTHNITEVGGYGEHDGYNSGICPANHTPTPPGIPADPLYGVKYRIGRGDYRTCWPASITISGSISILSNTGAHGHPNTHFNGSVGCTSGNGGVFGDIDQPATVSGGSVANSAVLTTNSNASATDNRPSYLTCIYIQCIK